MDLKVATWNIWVFGDRDTEGMAELIRKNDIDIIGTQEVAVYFDEDKPRNIAEEIAEELGYYYEFYPAIDFRPEKPYKMGNAVISRYPIEQSRAHKLNPDDLEYDGSYQTEPRLAVETRISSEENEISFLTTHLQYSYKFENTEIRQAQVQNLLSIIEELKNPLVLTGDFNSTPENEGLKKIEGLLCRVGNDDPTWTVHPFEHKGWTVEELKYRLDNIFISEDLKCQNTEIIESDLSDHLPVKATLKLED